ncbi:hypothetical protein SLE2022_010040 [Rubroshorea leprosula]
MDHHQWKPIDFSKSMAPGSGPPNSEHRQKPEVEVKDPIAARKVQKADREKLRRDRLNEQFLELGSTLDPDRPKNDKATILTDTIQVLQDLNAEVNRLKAECASLSEESRELMQEKNELREEKSSLKADIENLNTQYQQRLRVMFPWAGIDPSVVMAAPYTYPLPLPVTPSPIPMHPSLQPYPFFGNHAPGTIPAPCSTFIPFSTTSNLPVEQPSSQHASSSHVSSRRESKSKSVNDQRTSVDRSDNSNDVVTELELKIPGSSANQDLVAVEKKSKQTQKERIFVNESSPSHSSQGLPDSSCNSVDDGSRSSQ